MLSDLRVIDEPLDKWICRACALVRRVAPPAAELFSSGYTLYDHAPGRTSETARQEIYAAWIAGTCEAAPRSILDVGCGNGSLLLALRQYWPGARLRGIDPSRESTRHAMEAGLDVATGTLETTAIEPAHLVICVNVVEHADDPALFVSQLVDAMVPDGTLMIVCPDGRRPWAELLFADHASSFVPAHLAELLRRAACRIERVGEAPAALGPFMMIVARREASASLIVPMDIDPVALRRDKHAYLEQWRALDGALLARSATPKLVCFGIGEAAGLLRAYAPETWSRVVACAADAPDQAVFGDRPVTTPEGLSPGADLLLGVRPLAQEQLAARFRDRYHVIRWDDLIPA